jgi:hypothetical protein
MADDDSVSAWQRVLANRGQWRDDMGPILAAHADELPHPEEIDDHDGFDLRPDQPFPADEFPTPAGWFWEAAEEEPDEGLMERTLSDALASAAPLRLRRVRPPRRLGARGRAGVDADGRGRRDHPGGGDGRAPR